MSPLTRLRRALSTRPRRHVCRPRPDWLDPDNVRCWCGATPIPEPPMHEIPARQQIADAQAAYSHTCDLFRQARDAARAARDAYMVARAGDPAAQTTDQVRHAWVEAAHDEVDARGVMEQAADELAALHQQTATYAVMEETRG